MTTGPVLDRRTFLADLGHGAFAIALLSITGCAPAALLSPSPGASTAASGSAPSPTPPAGSPSAGSAPPVGPTWRRVNMGFVSAYILSRGGEAALVDTGTAGNADTIEASLSGLGLDWSAVAHVVITHHHNDHQGSLRAVAERAPAAAVYAGAEDVSRIGLDGAVTAVGDGDRVFDLEVVTAPGHTPGSICVLDPVAGVLVAGDALRTDGGKPILPSEPNTADMDLARQSVVKLGALTFEALFVGHGEPIPSGASALVAELGTTG